MVKTVVAEFWEFALVWEKIVLVAVEGETLEFKDSERGLWECKKGTTALH